MSCLSSSALIVCIVSLSVRRESGDFSLPVVVSVFCLSMFELLNMISLICAKSLTGDMLVGHRLELNLMGTLTVATSL
jgi:hypothetical protein